MSASWVAALHEIVTSGEPCVLATVVGHKGSAPREAGARLVLRAEGSFIGTVGGGQLEALVLDEARGLFNDPVTKTVRYPLAAAAAQCCGGSMEVMFEAFNLGPRLWLFGAGHVGQALAQTLQGTPFDVTAIDARDEWLQQLPPTVTRFAGEWDDFVTKQQIDARATYAVVMTHEHALDEDIVATLARSALPYIGLIGSESKWARFKDRLLTRGLTMAQIERVRCPIGVGRFGKAPQEVAISVAAELLRAHYATAKTTENT